MFVFEVEWFGLLGCWVYDDGYLAFEYLILDSYF